MSASDPTASLPIDLGAGNPAEGVMGGLLVSIFFACILYGMTTLQAFMYYQKYPNDIPLLRFLVTAVWILETVHTAFCMQFVYAYLISGFADFANFIAVHWSVGVAIASSVAVALCVQGYYTWRVYVVSGRFALWSAVIAFCALARVGFGIGSTCLTYIYPNWLQLRELKVGLATVSGGLGAAALVDLLVALTLTFYLKRNRTGFHKESNSMVNKILVYTVNTGAITGAASLVCVLLFAFKKDSLIFLGFFAIQTKLYANSFLGSLNARTHLRNASQNTGGGRMFSSNSRGGPEFTISSPRGAVPVIEVTRQTVRHTDHGESYDAPDELDMKVLKGGELPY
ncbi:hypothetical protein L227DRAFT_351086 [Lentinus tigrinus ALCF2SS1-6]|uniref:DUF6534 domain-containing protein n=1 Tax=Lentinus tigrinus ALCF2SS1-6 TaxID=1328759 RepID=A0A5C2RRP0_9APHY|nr:hypothetical protein L227DRAFT_351086 [Lentinus tigrinus ALCF2SS1-6]